MGGGPTWFQELSPRSCPCCPRSWGTPRLVCLFFVFPFLPHKYFIFVLYFFLMNPIFHLFAQYCCFNYVNFPNVYYLKYSIPFTSSAAPACYCGGVGLAGAPASLTSYLLSPTATSGASACRWSTPRGRCPESTTWWRPTTPTGLWATCCRCREPASCWRPTPCARCSLWTSSCPSCTTNIQCE